MSGLLPFSAAHLSAMGSDCRTRRQAYSHRHSRKSAKTPVDLPAFNAEGSAIRTFRHQRGVVTPQLQERRVTNASSPATFDETLAWFDALIDAERSVDPADVVKSTQSSVCMIFIDEKRCAKTMHEDSPMAKLQERLRIYDWAPAHYMSAFCRFPVPLESDDERDELDEESLQEDSRLWEWRYSISHPFDWDMIWAYLPRTRTSLGIVRTWFDGYDANFVDMEQAIECFPGPTLAHPMLLGLVALQILTGDTLKNVRDKGNRLFEAQKLTGFHNYARLRETEDAEGVESFGSDLALITKEILGASSNMTGWENAAQQLAGFSKFVAKETRAYAAATASTSACPACSSSCTCFSSDPDALPNPVAAAAAAQASQSQAGTEGASRRLNRYLVHQAEKLAGDLDGAYHDAQAWLETAQFLLQGVLNLISQHDANVNIALARDSKQIAEKSKRDSTSMTAIAVVTMFFLPGTFTASFFGLPFFEQELQDLGVPYFWIYWVVTVPLTVAVLLAWVAWTRLINPPPAGPEPVRIRRTGSLWMKSLKLSGNESVASSERTLVA